MVKSELEPGSLLQSQCPEGGFTWSGRHYIVGREDTRSENHYRSECLCSQSTTSTSSCPERLAGLYVHQWSLGFSRGCFYIRCSAKTKPLGGAWSHANPLSGYHRDSKLTNANPLTEVLKWINAIILGAVSVGWLASITVHLCQQQKFFWIQSFLSLLLLLPWLRCLA